MRQRVKLKITTVRRITFYPSYRRTRCPVCLMEVETLDYREAAHALNVGEDGLACLIASGRVHPIQLMNGSTIVCRDSLIQEQKAGRL